MVREDDVDGRCGRVARDELGLLRDHQAQDGHELSGGIRTSGPPVAQRSDRR